MANQPIEKSLSNRTWTNPTKATGLTALISFSVYFLIWAIVLDFDPKGYIGFPISILIPVLIAYPRQRHINKLLRQVEELNRELTDQNHLREKLLGIIGHDVRGPLASLIGIVDLYSAGGMKAEEFDEWIVKIKPELDFTRETLDRLVYWAKIQMNSDVENTEFRLGEIENSIASYGKKYGDVHQVQTHINWDQNALIKADRTAIQITLSNLLHNAIKHSPAGGKVMITSKITDREIHLFIEDQGNGLAQTELSRLFTAPMKRSEHYATGLGVGLFLCKEFIQMNGGTISAENALGGGALFSITLELA